MESPSASQRSSIPPRSMKASPSIKTATPSQPRSNATKQRSKKPLNFCGPQSFVTIIVGPESGKQAFTVHKNLLEHHSPYFTSAFNNPAYTESSTREMRLSDVSPDTFGIIINCLYTQTFLTPSGTSPHLTDLARVWQLAARFKMTTICNKSIRALDRCGFSDSPDSSDGIQAWKEYVDFVFLHQDLEGSVLKKKCVDDTMELFGCVAGAEMMDRLLEGIFGDAGGTAKGFLKEVVVRCAPVLKEMSEPEMKKGIVEYYVKEEVEEDD
ncbi:hypothetical protein B0J14DRAFT_650403 [Halenospora varia]|nr:hypothetical protein B0J14DRAFT_650403 [Halenospora varia]